MPSDGEKALGPEQCVASLRAAMVHTTSQLGHHGCTLVCQQIDRLARSADINIATWLPLHFNERAVDWRSYDLVLVNGEGSLHHDRWTAVRIAALGESFAKAGVRAYLINTVYEANSPATAAGVRRFRRVFVRDSVSQLAAEASGISATVVPDLSLTWQPPALPHGGIGPVVSDSTRRLATAELFHLAQEMRARFFSMLTRPPRLPDFPDRNLRERLRYQATRIMGRLALPGPQRAKTFGQLPDFDSFIHWLLDEAGFVVAGRFHAVCFCLLFEIPFVALTSNTRKIEGLCHDVGISGRVFDNIVALRQALHASGPAFVPFSVDETKLIRAFRTSARARAVAAFAQIASDSA